MRNENDVERAERLRREALLEAGQACLDWAQDTGDCHLCGYDEGAGKPHDEECPLRKLPRCPSCHMPWSPQNATTCGPCGAFVPNGPVVG